MQRWERNVSPAILHSSTLAAVLLLKGVFLYSSNPAPTPCCALWSRFGGGLKSSAYLLPLWLTSFFHFVDTHTFIKLGTAVSVRHVSAGITLKSSYTRPPGVLSPHTHTHTPLQPSFNKSIPVCVQKRWSIVLKNEIKCQSVERRQPDMAPTRSRRRAGSSR